MYSNNKLFPIFCKLYRKVLLNLSALLTESVYKRVTHSKSSNTSSMSLWLHNIDTELSENCL